MEGQRKRIRSVGRSRFEGKAEGEHWSKGRMGVEGYNDDGDWKGRRK